MNMLSFTLMLPIIVGSVLTFSSPDEITELPGLNYKINFRQYSGYLNATGGKFLHYWFVESQKNPKRDPLVLWLNGGPGCSSLDGLLTEVGPFYILTDGKTLYDNPFAWNKVTNIIFLEAPAGVGFSFSNSRNYTTNDDQTSVDNYEALQHFFEKFPQFKNNDFYITGESYAGIYIPTLSLRILKGTAKINFKGFAIGNGYLDVTKLDNSALHFLYNHGLLDGVTWNEIVHSCCNGCSDRCDFVSNNDTKCFSAVQNASDFVDNSGLNPYNIYSDCDGATAYIKKSRDQYDRKNLFKKFNLLRNVETSPCVNPNNTEFYLNQKSVRKALHIPTFVQDWDECIDINYTQIYDTMKPQVLTLLKSGKLRGLIYNGDVDTVCNFLGDEWFVEDLGIENLTEYNYWEFNGQTAGFYKVYKNLTFLTIKGSGHMVPKDKPGPALKMISSFLFNQPY